MDHVEVHDDVALVDEGPGLLLPAAAAADGVRAGRVTKQGQDRSLANLGKDVQVLSSDLKKITTSLDFLISGNDLHSRDLQLRDDPLHEVELGLCGVGLVGGGGELAVHARHLLPLEPLPLLSAALGLLDVRLQPRYALLQGLNLNKGQRDGVVLWEKQYRKRSRDLPRSG